MSRAVKLAEVWRGDLLESVHLGHAVICNGEGEIVEAWGDPELVMYPRSSCKMIQALPLVESGFDLSDTQLALACASHKGAAVHVDLVTTWLEELGLSERDLRCGPQMPDNSTEARRLIRAGKEPCQIHNNCSGKHAGFLALTQHMKAGPEYVEVDHPLQVAIRDAFEDVTGETSAGFGIDGCSAPNFSTSLAGLARAMGFFASAHRRSGARAQAAARLARAMATHPVLVADDGAACTELMRAMGGHVTVKTGAEAVYVAILPEQELGIALKVTDGATRGSECAITALLIRAGVLDAGHPAAKQFGNAPLINRRGLTVGEVRPSAALI